LKKATKLGERDAVADCRVEGLQEYVVGDGYDVSLGLVCSCGRQTHVASRLARGGAWQFHDVPTGHHSYREELFARLYREGGRSLESAEAAAARVRDLPEEWAREYLDSQ
jgi:hypothetical protein